MVTLHSDAEVREDNEKDLIAGYLEEQMGLGADAPVPLRSNI